MNHAQRSLCLREIKSLRLYSPPSGRRELKKLRDTLISFGMPTYLWRQKNYIVIHKSTLVSDETLHRSWSSLCHSRLYCTVNRLRLYCTLNKRSLVFLSKFVPFLIKYLPQQVTLNTVQFGTSTKFSGKLPEPTGQLMLFPTVTRYKLLALILQRRYHQPASFAYRRNTGPSIFSGTSLWIWRVKTFVWKSPGRTKEARAKDKVRTHNIGRGLYDRLSTRLQRTFRSQREPYRFPLFLRRGYVSDVADGVRSGAP